MNDNFDISMDDLNPTPTKRPKNDPEKIKFTQADSESFIKEYIKDSKCTICQKSFDTKKSFNVRRHYEGEHLQIFQAYFNQKKATQPTLFESFEMAKMNEPSRNFVLYAATTTFPRSHLKNQYLQDMFKQLKIKPMSIYQLSKSIEKEMNDVRLNIVSLIGKSRFSVSVDEVTTKSMTMSCFGTVVHFLNKKTNAICTAALDLKELKQRATSDYLREKAFDVVGKFGLNPMNVVRVVSDGARNMRKAFFKPFFDEDDRDFEENESVESEFEEDCIELESQEEQDEIIEEVFESDDVDDEDQETQSDQFNVWCCCHRIQLVAQDFVKESKTFEGLRKRVLHVISKFARSANATKELFARKQKKLLFPATTRWMSIVITFERVLYMHEEINSVAFLHDWDTIASKDVKLMQNLVKLLMPLKDMLLVWEHDGLTISTIYNGIQKLLKYYENLSLTSGFKVHCNMLVKIIRKRFDNVINGYDPIYYASTALDPREANGILQFKTVKAYEAVKQMAVEFEIEQKRDNEPEMNVRTTSLLNFSWDLPEENEEMIDTNGLNLSNEWDGYMSEYFLHRAQSPIEFWLKREQKYPILSVLALSLFTVPASTSSNERLFSNVTLETSGRKNRSKIKLVNQNAFMNYNKKFIK